MSDLLKLIKKAGLEAMNQSAPAAIMLGVVKQVNPLVITVEQRLDIPAEFLLLTDNVRDFSVDMTVDHVTENTSGGSGPEAFESHNHAYKGRKTFIVHQGLQVGDMVTLIRAQGGQKFVVLNRVVNA